LFFFTHYICNFMSNGNTVKEGVKEGVKGLEMKLGEGGESLLPWRRVICTPSVRRKLAVLQYSIVQDNM